VCLISPATSQSGPTPSDSCALSRSGSHRPPVALTSSVRGADRIVHDLLVVHNRAAHRLGVTLPLIHRGGGSRLAQIFGHAFLVRQDGSPFTQDHYRDFVGFLNRG